MANGRLQWLAKTIAILVLLTVTVVLSTLITVAESWAQSGALLSIIGRVCPVGYAAGAYRDACTQPLVSVEFQARGDSTTVSGRTNGRGMVALSGVDVPLFPGRLLLSIEPPSATGDRVVSCVDDNGFPVPVTHTPRGVELQLAEDAMVACDWYAIPLDPRRVAEFQRAELTIHNRICPTAYAGANFYATCHATPPGAELPFTIEGPETQDQLIDHAGNVTFRLAPGAYLVRGGVPGEFASARVFCAPAAAPGTPYPVTVVGGGVRGPDDLTGIRLVVTWGDAVICDWYNIPEDLRGDQEGASATLTIHHRICPVGYAGADFYNRCHDRPPTTPFEFTLEGPEPATGATNPAGNVVFVVAAGAYRVTGGVPGEFARINIFCAPADAPGTPYPITILGGGVRGPDDPTGLELTLEPGGAVICDWYNTPEDLGGQRERTAARTLWTTRASAPIALPRTGTGEQATDKPPPWSVLLAGGLIIIGLVATERRRP